MRNAFSCALLYRIRGLVMTDRGPLQSSWPGLDLASRTWNHPPMSLSMFLRSVWIMNRYCPDQSLKWMVATRDIPLYSYSMHLIGIQSNLYRSVMRFARKHEDIAMFKQDQAVYKAVKDTPAWWTIYIHFPQNVYKYQHQRESRGKHQIWMSDLARTKHRRLLKLWMIYTTRFLKIIAHCCCLAWPASVIINGSTGLKCWLCRSRHNTIKPLSGLRHKFADTTTFAWILDVL